MYICFVRDDAGHLGGVSQESFTTPHRPHQIRSPTHFVSWKDIKQVGAGLKKIYTAVVTQAGKNRNAPDGGRSLTQEGDDAANSASRVMLLPPHDAFLSLSAEVIINCSTVFHNLSDSSM